jgi:hypothetical protein
MSETSTPPPPGRVTYEIDQETFNAVVDGLDAIRKGSAAVLHALLTKSRVRYAVN